MQGLGPEVPNGDTVRSFATLIIDLTFSGPRIAEMSLDELRYRKSAYHPTHAFMDPGSIGARTESTRARAWLFSSSFKFHFGET